MHVTDLAINKTLGLQLAPPGKGYILEMPESPLLLNHVGTVHASVQFSLAEASSWRVSFALLGRLTESGFRRPSRFGREVPQTGSRHFTCLSAVC